MSFFRTDSSQAGNFEPVPVGTYEAFISEVEIKTYSTGNKGLGVKYTIRDDVDQEARKRIIFDNMVCTEKAMFKFHQVGKAIGIPDGTDFKNEADLLRGFSKAMKGTPVKIKVEHDLSRDRYPEVIKATMPTEMSAKGSGANAFAGSDPFSDDGKPVDISDEDLPF